MKANEDRGHGMDQCQGDYHRELYNLVYFEFEGATVLKADSTDSIKPTYKEIASWNW